MSTSRRSRGRVRPHRPLAALVLAALAAAGLGCNVIGPRSLRVGRMAYNQAINITNNEQLLLNLVRLRYQDTPLFLQVSTLSTSYEFSGGLDFDYDIRAGFDRQDAGIDFGFEENPRISYRPLQGEGFVEQLLTPIEIRTIILLYHSGWDLDRLLLLCVQRLNGVRNAPNASGPTPATEPEYAGFLAVAALLGRLQERGLVELGTDNRDGQRHLLRIDPAASEDPSVLELRRLLGLAPDRTTYPLVNDVVGDDPNEIAIGTRSLLGLMSFLAQAVEPAPGDVRAGRVQVTRTADGEPFDWQQVMGSVLRIVPHGDPPGGAAMAVRYRAKWYAIADDDLDSKATFNLLSQLFALQSGEVPAVWPIFVEDE